jgi:DNA-binding transcriptional ArsR family regulator
MPSRRVVAKELSEVFKILAHPDRVQIVEELGSGERDVNSLAEQIAIAGPRVSQHLALMRAHRVVEERRDGRHHYYRLSQPDFAQWIIEGLAFVEGRLGGISPSEIENARKLWSTQSSE